MSISLFILVLSLGITGLGFLGTFRNVKNEPAFQFPRWTFLIGNVLLAGALGHFLTAMLFKKVFDVTTGFWAVTFPILVGAYTLTAFINRAHKFYLISVAGNMFALANDKFFGVTDHGSENDPNDTGTGIRIYRIFFSGLKAKYPWETIEITGDLNRDTLIQWKFNAEFKDATGIVEGTATLRANSSLLQELVTTSTNSEERDKILSKIFEGLVKMIIGDKLLDYKIKDAMAVKSEICELMKGPDKKARIHFEEKHGVVMNSIVIADIDFTDEVKNAFEQQAVSAALIKSATELLRARGYTMKQIRRKDPDPSKNVTDAEWKKALDSAKETANEITRQIHEYQGLEGIAPVLRKLLGDK